MENELMENEKRLRVLVGVTAHEMVHASFLHGFSGAIVHLSQFAEVGTVFVVNREISQSRQMILEKAVAEGWQVVIFVDDMVILHPEALTRLATSKHTVTGFNHLEGVGGGGLVFSARKGLAPVVTHEGDDQCEMVDRMGLLLFQITLDAKFRKWFSKGFRKKPKNLFMGMGGSGEMHFAEMLKRIGIAPCIDHHISNTCGLLGQHTIFASHFKEA